MRGLGRLRRTSYLVILALLILLGLDPEKIIIRNALAEPHRAIAIATDDERAQFAALGEALKEWIKREASNAHSEQAKRYTSQK